jgi:preprotein translocase subunit SecF
MEFFKPGRVFDFMGMRKLFFTLSAILVLGGFTSMFWPGPNYGTDFRGGTEVEIAFKSAVNASQVRAAVESSGFQTPDVVQVQDEQGRSRFLIRVQDVTVLGEGDKDQVRHALCLLKEGETPDEARCPPGARATEVKFSLGGDKVTTRYDAPPDLEKIIEQMKSVPAVRIRASVGGCGSGPGKTPCNPSEINERDHRVEIQLQSKGDQMLERLREKLGADVVPDKALRVEWVGPKAGKQLRDSARNSIAIAALLIMVYLSFRFDLRFAPGVIVACMHDAFIVIGLFVLLRKEVTLQTIAAILTIVGYSMNDTVVVYDRIRENLSKHRGKSFTQIINLSVSETLSRTILTSGATMLSMLAFFFWGTGVIKDFALAMVAGIVVGTYSSIYIAAPLTAYIDEALQRRQKRAEARPAPPSKPAKPKPAKPRKAAAKA